MLAAVQHHYSTTICPAPWLLDAVITCSVVKFLKIFHICKNRKCWCTVCSEFFRQASKIATDVFVIKLLSVLSLVVHRTSVLFVQWYYW